jgi:diguanylate cyclase (GGDEF)-like protein
MFSLPDASNVGLRKGRKQSITADIVACFRAEGDFRPQRASRVLACLLLVAAGVHAQQYVFHAYRQPEGLKNLSVNAMATDREGFLWLATENGVFRFLGSRFERFGTEQGIAEIDARSIAADPDGSIWVGTNGNVYRWDGHRFLAVGPRPVHIQNEFGMAVEDERHLLVVDNERLFRLEHDAAGKILTYAPLFSDTTIAKRPSLGHVAGVSVVSEDVRGARVWFGCGKELCAWLEGPAAGNPKGEGVVNWGRIQDLPEDRWDSVLLDRTGTLWAGGAYHVAALQRGQPNFVDRTIPGSDPRSSYSHAPLIEDHQGGVLAPGNGGVARWNGTTWQTVGAANGLGLTGHIVGMAFDREEDLWLCVHGDGLYNWAGYSEWEGWIGGQGVPSAVIWDVVPYGHDRLLAGTDKGPAWISKENGAAGPLFTGRWSFGEVDAMGTDRDGSLWAGTLSGGVLRIDPKSGRTAEIAKLPVPIIGGVLDRAGRLFFGTRDRIWTREARGDVGHFHRVIAVDNLLPDHTTVEAGCLAPDGAVWFLAQNQLLREQDNVWTKPPIDGLSHLPGDLLALSCAKDGSLWATGEQDGAWRLMPRGDRVQAWRLTVPPELQSLAPLAILADRRGWIWLGTDLGVLAWNGHQWRHLTQESGLIWNDIDQSALAEDPDGSLWIGTSGGLSHLLHPERVFDPQPVGISITDVKRGSQNVSVAKRLVLPWALLPLNIEISSPTMLNRSGLVFEYQMKGLHRGWIVNQNGEGVFSGLPPGNYTFSARAVNPDLNAASETLEMQIAVLPPWWQTWWMFALYALCVAALLWGAYRLYAGHLLARGKALEILVSERTRELEASRAQLRIQASHDELTGMLNRKAILAALAAEMKRALRDSTTVVVALVDLDRFKRINDECGHLAGDEALRLFADAVRKAIRAYDHAGRYGGEEFLLVLSRIPRAEIELRLLNLQSSISNIPFRWQEKDYKINCSVGVAVYNAYNDLYTLESLLSAADRSLYLAKASGRNRVVFSDSGWSDGKAGEPRECHAPAD